MLSKILGILSLQQLSLSTPPPDKSSPGPVPVTIPGFFIARAYPKPRSFRSILCRKASLNKGLFCLHDGKMPSHNAVLPERESAGAPACASRADRKRS